MPTNRNVVLLSEIRAERMLADIRDTFAGPGPSEADAMALAARVAEQLRVLPLERRRLLRRHLAVAVDDLEGLIAALAAEMANLATDLRALNRHTDAAGAYCRGTHVTTGSKHL